MIGHEMRGESPRARSPIDSIQLTFFIVRFHRPVIRPVLFISSLAISSSPWPLKNPFQKVSLMILTKRFLSKHRRDPRVREPVNLMWVKKFHHWPSLHSGVCSTSMNRLYGNWWLTCSLIRAERTLAVLTNSFSPHYTCYTSVWVLFKSVRTV